MTQFVTKAKVASSTFGTTTARLVKFYLMNSLLVRAQHAEEARAKSGGKSANGRYVPFVGSIEFCFKTTTPVTVAKKSSRYMSGRLNELRPIEQTREVHIAPDSSGGLSYSFFVELKDAAGREISTMVSTKHVSTFLHGKEREKVDVDLLDEVAADMFSFLYSQRPEEKALKELRLQAAA